MIHFLLINRIQKNVVWLDDLKNNDIYTVCALNGTLQLLISDRNPLDLSQFTLFDGNDTNGNNLIGSLDKNLTAPLFPISLAKSIKSESGCFTIKTKRHILTFTGDVALFRIVEETTKNCENENNVYQTPHAFSRIPASMTATKKGSCELIILSATEKDKALPFIWLSNITANSNLEKFTFKSTINNKILIEINGSDILIWQTFGIYTPALSIIIPESNKITVNLDKVSPSFSWNYSVSGLLQNGLLMTPYDCGFDKTFTNYLLYNFNLDRATMIDFKYIEKTNNFPQINDVPLLNSTTSFLGNVGVTANRTSANMDGFLIQYTIHPPSLVSTTAKTTAKITSSHGTTPTTKMQSSVSSTTPAPTTTAKITSSHATTPTTKKQSSVPSSTTTAPTTTAKITSSYVKTSTTKSTQPSTTTTPTTTIITTSTTKIASTTTKHVASSSVTPSTHSTSVVSKTTITPTITTTKKTVTTTKHVATSSMAPQSTSIVSKTTTSPTTTATTTKAKFTSTPAVATSKTTTKPSTTSAAKTTTTTSKRPPSTTTTIKNGENTSSTKSQILTSTNDESVSPSSIFTESLTKSSTILSTTTSSNSNARNTWSFCFTVLAQIIFMTLYFVHL